MSLGDWHEFCDHVTSAKHMKPSQANKANRGQQSYTSNHGSKSYAQSRHEELKKHLVTASYINDTMCKLHDAAKDSGITILGEMGLDPGIDREAFDDKGNLTFDAIVKQNESSRKIVYSQHRDIIPKVLKDDEKEHEEDADKQKEIVEMTEVKCNATQKCSDSVSRVAVY